VEPRPHAHTAESRELSPHAPIPRLIACLTLLITAPAHAQTKAGDLVWQNQFDLAGEALECLRELGWIRAEVAIARTEVAAAARADAPLQPLSFSMGAGRMAAGRECSRAPWWQG